MESNNNSVVFAILSSNRQRPGTEFLWRFLLIERERKNFFSFLFQAPAQTSVALERRRALTKKIREIKDERGHYPSFNAT